MESHSRSDDLSEPRKVLEGQLRECYGRVVYSHKTHEKCVDILLLRLSRIKLAQIVLSAGATVGFVGAILGAGATEKIIGMAISAVLLALNIYTKDYDLGELAQKHKQAANDLWLIREKYLSLLTDLAMGQKPIEILQEQRDKLLEDLHAVYTGSPSTTYKAYKKAQKALKELEDLTFSDKEIDVFLPHELKRNKQ